MAPPIKLACALHAAILLVPSSTPAAWHWTPAAGDTDLYLESNWVDPGTGNPLPANALNPNTDLDRDLVVTTGTPGGPSGAPPHLQLGPSGTLTVSGGTVRLSASPAAGIRSGAITIDGGDLLAQFIANGNHTTIAAGSLTLYGGGAPINASTVDFPENSSGLLFLPAESPADTLSEHLAKITVAGQPATVGADPAVSEPGDNLVVLSDGAAGSVVQPAADPVTISSFSAAPAAINTPGQIVTLSWNVPENFDTLTVTPGPLDAAPETVAGVGAIDVSPTSTTTYTLTLVQGTTTVTAQTTVTVGGLSDVRINEIMAANTLSVEDEDGSNSDWIELANHGGAPADLSGYFLTDDPTNPELWQFPVGTTVAPGDTLIVFASNKNRTTPGGEELHTNFRLDNDGEYLALVFPDGTTVADSLHPAFPPLPADVSYGLNPAADRLVYFTTPTPDAANNAGAPSIGLLVRATLDSPPLTPDDTTLVLTTTVVRPQTAGPVSTVHAIVRTNYTPESVALNMADDGQAPDATAGDNIYTVAVPLDALAPGDMLRWRIEATTFGGLTTQDPPYPNSRQSPQYFGTMVQDPGLSSGLPALHWFIQTPNRANNTTGTRCSLFYNGEFYDNVFVRTRGGSTSGLAKKSYKFDFNPGYKFKFHPDEGRVEEFNLNTTATDKTYIRQSLAYDVYDLCGAPGGTSFPMHVRQNGSFFSVAAFVEQPDDDLLDREDLDDRGALYKMFNNFGSATSGVEKKNRKHENNADLNNFIRAMRNKTGDALDTAIFDHVDTPRMLNYLVGNTLTANGDSMSKNHYLYRDSDGTGEWTFLPWDLDLTFGRHYMTDDNIRGDTIWADEDWVLGGRSRNVPIAPSHPFMGSRSYPGNRSYNQLIDRLFSSDRFVDMFRRRFRSIIDEILQPLDTPAGNRLLESLIDTYAATIGPDAAADLAKWGSYGQRQTMAQAIAILKTEYLDVRRQHLFVTHHADNVATYPFPASRAESVAFPDAQAAAPEINLVSAEPSPASGNPLEEYVQLLNPNPTPVDLSGWKITGGIRHTFRPGTVIESAGSLFLAKDATAFRARATTPKGGEGRNLQDGYSGQLSARGETIVLERPDTTVASTLTTTPSPSLLQQHLRITELDFAPVAGKSFEWIELHNTSATNTLDLAGAYFSDGITFTFPPGTTLAPGAYAVIVADQTSFGSAHGNNPTVLGTYTGNLDNSGEQLTLRDATGENIQSFRFDGDWFSPARNGAYTLQITDPSLPWDAWDHPSTWDLSLDANGTPGSANPPEVSTSYQAWARANLSPELTSENVLRYALADIPLTINPDQTITLTRPANARDLTYTLQVTSDLKSWTDLPLSPLAPPTANGDGTETLHLNLPGTEKIARISVVLQE